VIQAGFCQPVFLSAKIVVMNAVYFDMVGCRLNQAEIEAMAREFSTQGYQVVDREEKADLIVVNTCCVTLKAAADSRKMLRHYQTHTTARVISTGCWNSVFTEQAHALLKETDQIVNNDKDRLVELVTEIREPDVYTRNLHLGHRQHTRGFVKVQDGCNNRCSYCLTQIARGASRSESVDRIITTINLLVDSDIKEVVLTGVQLGSWGKDLGKLRIYNLIDRILESTHIPRIRLSSIEPWDVSKELIERFVDPRLCQHLHIPIQSGSDQVLRLMRRPFACKDINGLLDMIRILHLD
jgi:threonylcarbamoyladenosine tRNA methylthiotransferase MtaB